MFFITGAVVVVIVWQYLQISMQSVPITTNFVSLNPAQARCTRYNIMWFSPGTMVSSTNKTGHHDITEILLKVALNTIILTLFYYPYINLILLSCDNLLLTHICQHFSQQHMYLYHQQLWLYHLREQKNKIIYISEARNCILICKI